MHKHYIGNLNLKLVLVHLFILQKQPITQKTTTRPKIKRLKFAEKLSLLQFVTRKCIEAPTQDTRFEGSLRSDEGARTHMSRF